jgi:hypothetical protein
MGPLFLFRFCILAVVEKGEVEGAADVGFRRHGDLGSSAAGGGKVDGLRGRNVGRKAERFIVVGRAAQLTLWWLMGLDGVANGKFEMPSFRAETVYYTCT